MVVWVVGGGGLLVWVICGCGWPGGGRVVEPELFCCKALCSESTFFSRSRGLTLLWFLWSSIDLETSKLFNSLMVFNTSSLTLVN